jgi:hypothetical protein
MRSVVELRGPAHGSGMREPCLEIMHYIIRFILAQVNDLMLGVRQAEFLSTNGDFVPH